MKNTTETNITLTSRCPFCGKSHCITVNVDAYTRGFKAREKGVLIQNAFPTFNADEREFLLTGICKKCWDEMAGPGN